MRLSNQADGVTGDRDKKAHSDVTKRYISTSSLPDRENRKVEIVGAQIELINSVLVRIKCLDPSRCTKMLEL